MVQCKVCLYWKVSERDLEVYGGLGGRCQKLKKLYIDSKSLNIAPGYINWYMEHKDARALVFHADYGCVRGQWKYGYPRIEIWIEGMDFPVEMQQHIWTLAKEDTLELKWTRQPYHPEGDVSCKYFHSADVITLVESTSVDGDKYIFEIRRPNEE